MEICSIQKERYFMERYDELESNNMKDEKINNLDILDIFPNQLSKIEARNIDFLKLYKEYEKNIKSFFIKIFNANSQKIYIRPQQIINISDNYLAVKGFSSYDKRLIKEFCSYKRRLILVNKLIELEKILELSIREVVLSDFYTDEIAIQGNFDLSFPIFFHSNKMKNLAKKYADEDNLYIRSVQ